MARLVLLATCLGGLAVAVAGCGYTAGADQASNQASNQASTGEPTTVPGSAAGPARGMSVRPCTGPYADVAVEGQPALTLTDATPNPTGVVPVGGLVQVQLQGSWHWSLGKTSSNLVATQYQGAFDQTRHVCFWSFRAQSAGNAVIAVTGTALCEGGQACPAIARAESFTVQVR